MMPPVTLINFNMGCIETKVVESMVQLTITINFNMGCIETFHRYCRPRFRPRLTLTWDVLKHAIHFHFYRPFLRLTLTWDVLKPPSSSAMDFIFF